MFTSSWIAPSSCGVPASSTTHSGAFTTQDAASAVQLCKALWPADAKSAAAVSFAAFASATCAPSGRLSSSHMAFTAVADDSILLASFVLSNAFMRPWNNTLPQCMMVTGSIQRSHSGPYPRHARFSTDGPSALSLSLACMMPGKRKKSPLSISMAISFCLSCQFAFVSSPQTTARTAWPMRKRWHQMPPQMHPQPQRLRSSAPLPPGY